ncbi:probable G-protein coupled receptor 132b isoform X2 [Electrophorus electricus]|uniref:G-protein coupled receptors family 1 profile domain-containing protein n=2 Tax=Electrophorus electricus TaxID=8005 RepID=A0A4W4F3T6_ELEEL|nr:probable G-protein coupled receptor 132b isoform X2 [Electrophorus electricus]XP_026880935.2 probable G-protein coupled receptor 132b isoform X2 [Electrophorus electricus]
MENQSVTQTFVTVTSGNRNCTFPYSEDRVPLVTLYSIVLLVGVPANLATVYLTLLQVRQRNILGVYLLSLSVCDLTYLLTLPLWALYVDRGHNWSWGRLTCQVTGYVFFTNMYISIFLLCCISVDRYVAVVYALESRGQRRQRWAVLVTATGCLVIGLAHLPVFTMATHTGTSTDKRDCFEPNQRTPLITAFNYTRFTAGFLAPLIVLVFTNRAVLASIRASATLQPSQKKRVCLLVVAVVLLFLVCFGPYHIILLGRAITYHLQWCFEECHFEQHVYTPYVISLGLSTMNSAANPILYVLSSDNIQKEIRSILTRLWGQTPLSSHSKGSSDHKMHSSENNISQMSPTRDQDKTHTQTASF